MKSPVLDSLLTTPSWTDRYLGHTRSVTVRNDRLWLATGNNAQFGGDLGRRIATVHLAPPTANHFARTDFEIKDLRAWMVEHRAEYLTALLTLARGWINAGGPQERARSDSFATWVEGIRGIMKWAGFRGVFGGGYNANAVNDEDQDWANFLQDLHRVFGDAPFQTKDIVKHLGGQELQARPGQQGYLTLDVEYLPGDLAAVWTREHSYSVKPGGFARSIGKWLAFREGRFAAGWQLTSAGRDGKSQKPLYVVKPPTR